MMFGMPNNGMSVPSGISSMPGIPVTNLSSMPGLPPKTTQN
jgi:hypothetical protein